MQATRQRLTRKLLLLFILPPLLCTLGMMLLSSSDRRAELLAEADRELADHVTVLRSTLPQLAPMMDRAAITAWIEQLAKYERVHGIALYDRGCRAIARSEYLNTAAGEIDALVCQGNQPRPEQHRSARLAGHEVLVRSEPIFSRADVGAIAVTYDLSEVRAFINAGNQRMLLNGGLIALCMATLALLIARSLGRALGTLVQAAESIAAGDLTVRVQPPNFLELGRLGQAFNQMTDSIQAAQRALLAGESRHRELQRRLWHAQALRAIGQVAASLAHEIASPLSTILGWSRLLANDPALAAASRQQAGIVAQQCERITRMVGRLMSVSRLPESARQQISLRQVAVEVAAFLQPECQARQIDLRTEFSDPIAPVFAERDACLQILINLCLNAVQVQGQGGRVVLSLCSVSGQAWGRCGDWAQIEVRDAGPGIPPDRRQTLFEPFYSTRREGHGLGLAIVHDIVQKLDGLIEVGEAPEGGACFRVLLPSGPADHVVPPGFAGAPSLGQASVADSAARTATGTAAPPRGDGQSAA